MFDDAAFAKLVSDLAKEIKQRFHGKRGLRQREIREILVKFLYDEEVEDQHLVAYLRVLEEEAKDDSGARVHRASMPSQAAFSYFTIILNILTDFISPFYLSTIS